MSAHTYNAIRIAFALAAFGVVGAMDMEDAIAQDQALPALQCREKLKLRLALTADEARGRCDQTKGTMK